MVSYSQTIACGQSGV